MANNEYRPQRSMRRTYSAGPGALVVQDYQVIPTSLVDISPILRIADDIEKERPPRPRIAFLCRLCALFRAHDMDPKSVGRGVRQFKSALLHKLEPEGAITEDDKRELQEYYDELYAKYEVSIKGKVGASVDRDHLAEIRQKSAILFEVLKFISPQTETEGKEVDDQTKVLVAYNILPLDPDGESETIMTLPEIKAVRAALQNVRGLLPDEFGSTSLTVTKNDLLDWLGSTFGFQGDNVKNQREHLILLLANTHARQVPIRENKLSDTALSEVMEKLFKNYKTWCSFLSCSENLRLPSIQNDIEQRKILYIGLYLLIWGEAANLRFMPECLCYIFHQLARDLNNILAGENTKLTYRENPTDQDSFLVGVVTPIYKLIAEEFSSTDCKKGHHSAWRNYDDLNEYFWSIDCFSLSWSTWLEGDFFRRKPKEKHNITAINMTSRGVGKINFVETHSFWHIFRSFDRMWSFLIMSLQVMIIIAWNGIGFTRSVLMKVMSIFITYAFLTLIQAVVHVGLSVKAWRSMKCTDLIWYALKVLAALSWTIVLPILYVYSTESRYVIAVLVFLSPDAVSAFLFLFPTFRQAIEHSEQKFVRMLSWWEQPRMYVGCGTHESPYTQFKYTLFWVLVFTCKLLVSYYLEIRPLVGPTKDIMAATATAGPFPNEKHNFGVVIILWAPIVMVFFMDIQIWYTVMSTILGALRGMHLKIGEVRTLEVLKSRFRSLPGAFNANLVSLASNYKAQKQFFWQLNSKSYKALDGLPHTDQETSTDENSPHNGKVPLNGLCSNLPHTEEEKSTDENSRHYRKNNTRITDSEVETAIFSHLWNAIINNLWQEDYIQNLEMELLLIPCFPQEKLRFIQWPAFLLVNKVALAVRIVESDCNKANMKDEEIFYGINQDPYMKDAVLECYELLQDVLRSIIIGNREKRIIEQVIANIEKSIEEKTLFKTFRVTGLVSKLFDKIVDFIRILENLHQAEELTLRLQDILNVYLEASPEMSDGNWAKEMHNFEFQKDSVRHPYNEDAVKEKIRRLYLMLTMEEVSLDFPINIEARRRIRFFVNSLFMEMPSPPPVQKMLSCSILTPYNGERILFTKSLLKKENEDRISNLYYLKKVYSDEWENLLKRLGIKEADAENLMRASDEIVDEVCRWASFRAQTLTRTVRGMMYYRKALEMHAFFEMAQSDEIPKGCKSVLEGESDDMRIEQLRAKIQALADLKFTYVISCQDDEFHKHAGKSRANDIKRLLLEYPSLRVAYVEVEESEKKEYYSVLVKGVKGSHNIQTVYKIKLPGQPVLGEGKSENQNHAIIFTRGDALQTIDMNQDSYLEEALKMRNLLQELTMKNGTRTPSILGMSKHIFSGSVSSLAGFMLRLESTFASLGQRVLANPLKVRFHYGHPDVFDRLFHLSRGGISKASPIINLSEHMFAGFNTVLRRGVITHHEYIQVGKGIDAGLTQITLAETRNSTGIGEQTISRDIYRLGRRLDFFRMCSVYCSTVGPYVNVLIAVLVVYVFLYGRLYLSLNGFETNGEFGSATLQGSQPLQIAMLLQALVLIGFLLLLPMMMEIGLEKGFLKAFSEFFIMQFQLASVFFTFLMGTRIHFYGRTLLHGGVVNKRESVQSKHSFVIFHTKFSENYRLYSRSHFTKAFELLMLLIAYHAYGVPADTLLPFLITSFLWFLVVTWLFAPFLFNPSGFEWQKMVEDYDDFMKWINNRGGIGVPAERSWGTWWEDEQKHLRYTGILGQVIESLLATRFLIYQYALIHHLHITKGAGAYFLSLFILLCLFLIPKVTSKIASSWNDDQLKVRLVEVTIAGASLVTFIVLLKCTRFTFIDLFIIILAVLPAGWGVIQIVKSWRWAVTSKFTRDYIWDPVESTAMSYEILMGCMLLLPIAILSWFPFVSDFQNRVLFNEALSRGLQISRILAYKKVN